MRRLLCLTAALLLLPLAGCWNYSELNERTLIAGAAVDLTESGELLLTVEAADFSEGSDPAAESTRLTGRGGNLAEAMHDVTEHTGRELYWDQASLLIVNSRYAERGLRELLDYILNEHGLRLTLLLAVSRLETAAEVLELEIHGAPLRSYALCDMIRGGGESGETIAADARQAINTLLEPGREFVLPQIGKAADGGGERAEASGCALFRGDRQIGWLDGEETRYLALLTGCLRRTELSATVNGGAVTVEARGWRTALRTKMENGRVDAEALISADYELLTAEALDLKDPGAEEALNEALSRQLTACTEALCARLRDLGCDAAGIMRRLHQRDPAAFRTCPDLAAAYRESRLTLRTDFHNRSAVSDGSVLQRPEGTEGDM